MKDNACPRSLTKDHLSSLARIDNKFDYFCGRCCLLYSSLHIHFAFGAKLQQHLLNTVFGSKVQCTFKWHIFLFRFEVNEKKHRVVALWKHIE